MANDPRDENRKTDPDEQHDEERVTGIGQAAIEGAAEGAAESSSPDSTRAETDHAGMSDSRSRDSSTAPAEL